MSECVVFTIYNINTLFCINRKSFWEITIPYVAEEFNNVPGTGGCGYILVDYILQFKESEQKVWRNFEPIDRSLTTICSSIKDFISKNLDNSFKELKIKLENIIKSRKEHLDKKYWLTNWEFLTLLDKLNINYAYFQGSEENSLLKLISYHSSNITDFTRFMSSDSS